MPTATDATLHELDTPYPLTNAQVEAFNRDGFIKLKRVLSPAVIEAYRPLLREVTMEHNHLKDVPMDQRTTYQKAFIQVTNLWRRDERVHPLVFSKRLARIAADLLRVGGVRLWHDQALYKEKSGGFTPWHADQYYWPMATDRSVTAWIPLQPTPMEMGPLAFAVGSQRFTGGRDLQISDDSEQQLQAMIAKENFPMDNGPFDLGEVSFHLGWTYHRAGPNQTGDCREVMTMIYMDKDMPLAAPRNKHQQDDWDNWAPGVKIGEPIASPVNPLLYERGAAGA